MKKVYIGILAGGNGTRLWPLSTMHRPKQLLPFLNGKSLLQQTIDRVKTCVASKDDIFIVTKKMQRPLIEHAVGRQVGWIVEEPVGRNTGPAILLGCHHVVQRDPDAVVVFVSADHFIPDKDSFLEVLQEAIAYVSKHKKISTLGVKPRDAATGYGYIQAGAALSNDHDGFAIAKFHEKPDQATADKYLQQKNMFWNIGIFAAQAAVLRDEYAWASSKLYDDVQLYLKGEAAYKDLESISIDYAVMEKSTQAVMFSGDFEWHDVGDLKTFLALKEQHEGKPGNVIHLNSTGNLVHSQKKVVACIGVDDLCVVETGDALIIAKKDQVEQVKELYEKLMAEQGDASLIN